MKMIQHAILLLLLCLATFATAQQNNLIVGFGTGNIPYEGTMAWGGDVEYERFLNDGLSVFVSAGWLGDRFTEQGYSMGTDGTTTWDNNWKYDFSERFQFVDLGVKERILRIGEKYSLHSSLGATFGQSVFKYPETLVIEKGVILQQEQVTRRVEVWMLNVGIEQRFKVTEHFFIGLNAAFRTTFGEKHVLSRVINFDYGTISSTSGIRSVSNVNLVVGTIF